MDRTVRLLLCPTSEQAAILVETVSQFTAVFNAVCAYGWQQREKNGARLHHATYYPLKAEYPGLFGLRRWRELEARYFRLRRALQSKGTRSAGRHLRRLRGKQLRLRRDLDHQLSRQIVSSVEPGSVIVVENLKDIRKRVKQRRGKQNRRIHSWSFAQLRSFLSYKAQESGCQVVGVDPRQTSQACPRCGCAHRHNRRSRSEFRCRDCGFQLNADLVGARNIAAKYLAGIGTSDPSGPPVNRPIVSQSGFPLADASCRP